jgi:hypothetical protein
MAPYTLLNLSLRDGFSFTDAVVAVVVVWKYEIPLKITFHRDQSWLTNGMKLILFIFYLFAGT